MFMKHFLNIRHEYANNVSDNEDVIASLFSIKKIIVCPTMEK